jgi:DNA-binding beta-propeller fold protein YncE
VGAAARFNAQGAATFAGVAPATAGALLAFDAYHAVRVVDIASATVSLLAGTPGIGEQGFTDGAATSAQFNSPAGAYFNAADGSIFVADTRNNAIRLIAAYALPVTASTAAGTTCASQPYAYGTISLGGYTGGNYAPFNTCGTFVDFSNSVTLTWPNTWCACIAVCPAIAIPPPPHSSRSPARRPRRLHSSRRRFDELL